jgi:DNA-binding response OmpR family regulator
MAPPRVLVVEDEPNIRELVCLHLQREGYECDAVADGRAALARSEADRFDLIVLDLMIPHLDGLALCRAVRAGSLNRDVPILMLTARRQEEDKVAGLDSGADDYLTKPFGVRELVARARALLRRPRAGLAEARADGPGASSAGAANDGIVRVQGVEINVPKRTVKADGRSIELTDQEFRLLHVLASQPGVVFSREALLQQIWQGHTFVTVRSVDTLVKRLRRRIEPDPGNPRYLLTVWGVGYKFADGS